jgi:hypothetical protein
MLDLSEAGVSATWETLVELYGFDPRMELVTERLYQSPADKLRPHLASLLGYIQMAWGDDNAMKDAIDENREE